MFRRSSSDFAHRGRLLTPTVAIAVTGGWVASRADVAASDRRRSAELRRFRFSTFAVDSPTEVDRFQASYCPVMQSADYEAHRRSGNVFDCCRIRLRFSGASEL